MPLSIPHDDTAHQEEEFAEQQPDASVKTWGYSPQPQPHSPKKTSVRLTQLQEYLAVERGLAASCRTLPVTLALWIVFVGLVLVHNQARQCYEASNIISDSMTGVVAPQTVVTSAGTSIKGLTLDSIVEVEDILDWLEGGFIPLLTSNALGFGQVADQQAIGYTRVWQIRGGPKATCSLLSSDQAQFYSGPCYSAGGPQGKFGPQVTATMSQAVKDQLLATNSAFNQLADLPGGYMAWLDIGRNSSAVAKQVQYLRDNTWLDLNTQEVTLDTVFVNAQANVYTGLSIYFKIYREGYVDYTLTSLGIRGDVFDSWAYIFLDAIWGVMILGLIIQCTHKFYVMTRKGLLKLHLRDPYMWLDWFLIVVAITVAVYFYYLTVMMDNFIATVNTLPEIPQYSIFEAPDSKKVGTVLQNIAFQNQVQTIILQLKQILTALLYHRVVCLLYAALLVLRFCRGLIGQPRTAVLIQTILYAVDFFQHYITVFVLVLAHFTFNGQLLFGEQLDTWATIGRSICSALLVLFFKVPQADFDKANPVCFHIWFWTFFFVMGLFMLNILTAAIIDNYREVRTRLGEPGATLLDQAWDILKSFRWRRSYLGSKKHVPGEALLEIVGKDMDPAVIETLGMFLTDRRLCTRDDLMRAENDVEVDVPYLVMRGGDPLASQRLLERVTEWKQNIGMTTLPSNKLMVTIAELMTRLKVEADLMTERVHTRVERATRCLDRVDIKHAKCLALAKRISKAQEAPPGWTCHYDADGVRYLRHEQTGLTSWTLPRSLI